MIDLTPLDVRKKRGDFAKALRGYDAQEVDVFLEIVAERMEVLVKENLKLKERSERLGEQVDAQEGREQAVQEALVTAQELRRDVKNQAQREAELLEREAQGRIEQMLNEAERLLNERRAALEELERRRTRFLKAFRTLLERELDAVEVESSRAPLEDVTLDLELGRGSWTVVEEEEEEAGDESEEMAAVELDEEADVESAEVDDADAAEAAVSGDDEDADIVETVEVVDDGVAADLETDTEKADAADDVDETTEPVVPDSLWLSSILKRDQETD